MHTAFWQMSIYMHLYLHLFSFYVRAIIIVYLLFTCNLIIINPNTQVLPKNAVFKLSILAAMRLNWPSLLKKLFFTKKIDFLKISCLVVRDLVLEWTGSGACYSGPLRTFFLSPFLSSLFAALLLSSSPPFVFHMLPGCLMDHFATIFAPKPNW